MHCIVLATVQNVLGKETEIAANQLGALSIKEFCFVDQAEAIKAAYAYAEEFNTNPERFNHINGELVYVTKVEAYVAFEKKNGDIDYDSIAQIPGGVAYIRELELENLTYAHAYARITECLFEYFRLYGLEEQSVQIDGIDSMESSELGSVLSSLTSEIRFTVYDKNRENPVRFRANIRQYSYFGFFPEFEDPKKVDEISDYEEEYA